MTPLNLDTLATLVQARMLAPSAPAGSAIAGVSTDTRSMQRDSLFVALRGSTHDGHQHLRAAAGAGAIAALVDCIPADAPPGLPLIVVDNTRRALARLAAHVRDGFNGSVIAVAGSNGKTGTKGLIHAALHPPLRGSASPKSFNNDIGVPLTIFSADPKDDYLVLELGTNHPGEIAQLSEIAQPDIAVITNIGAEHLEFFGDLDGVRAEEASVIQRLNRFGLLVVNGDDLGLLKAVEGYHGQRVTFGWDAANDLRPLDVRCKQSGTEFRLGRAYFFVPQLGRHTAANAAAAIAVGRYLGLSDAEIAGNLATAAGPPMRLQVQRVGGVTLINDAYNANPHSMRAALETLRDLPTTGRRIAILGDMRELGEAADRFHAEVGRLAAECGLDELHCVGPASRSIAAAAIDAGQRHTHHHANAAAAASAVPAQLQDGDLVLLKASRGEQLESIASAAAQRHPPSPV
jgi:UDP-N-acetylmuramoyl-tripeptide--D-alanyl-D-alanine ligase